MNNIQKENAKVAIEYWTRTLDGECVRVECRREPCAVGSRWVPEPTQPPSFQSSCIRYRIAPETVEHKGGKFPKPVALEDAVIGCTYYTCEPQGHDKYHEFTYKATTFENTAFERGQVHVSDQNAIEHTDVMLGCVK